MPYKFLADESCPDPVADALEAAGHDMVRVADVMRSAADDAVLAAAFVESGSSWLRIGTSANSS